jgi:hypothetical protein
MVLVQIKRHLPTLRYEEHGTKRAKTVPEEELTIDHSHLTDRDMALYLN